jgi:hypothetical protein
MPTSGPQGFDIVNEQASGEAASLPYALVKLRPEVVRILGQYTPRLSTAFADRSPPKAFRLRHSQRDDFRISGGRPGHSNRGRRSPRQFRHDSKTRPSTTTAIVPCEPSGESILDAIARAVDRLLWAPRNDRRSVLTTAGKADGARLPAGTYHRSWLRNPDSGCPAGNGIDGCRKDKYTQIA